MKNRSFPSGTSYLHLTFLGVVSLSIFAFLKHFELLKIPKTFILLFLIGFFGSEILITYKGVIIWLHYPLFPYYFELLAGISSLLTIAIVYLMLYQLRLRR